MSDHVEGFREVPIESLGLFCTDLSSALCSFSIGEKVPPKVPVEQELALFDQMAILGKSGSDGATNTDETFNEEHS